MRPHRKFFLREIRQHYSGRYIIALLGIGLFIMVPVLVIILITKVRFDPAEFINLYLSTTLTSLFIAFALQGLEIYRLSYQKYFKLLEILLPLENLLKLISNGLSNDKKLYDNYVYLLIHYKGQLLQNLVADISTNEMIIQIHNSEELSFLIENLDCINIESSRTVNDIKVSATTLFKLIENFKTTIHE